MARRRSESTVARFELARVNQELVLKLIFVVLAHLEATTRCI